MKVLSSELLNFACQLIAREKQVGGSSERTALPVFQVCVKLRDRLSKLMGLTAFGALLSRALTLAKADAHRLAPIQVAPDGSLTGLAEMEKGDPDKVTEAEIVLVAHLIGLLVTFIGKGLTVSLTREIWPDISPDDLNSEKK